MAPDQHTIDADERAIERLSAVRDLLAAEKSARLAAGRRLWLAVAVSFASGLAVVVGVTVGVQRIEREGQMRAEAIVMEQRARSIAVCESGNDRGRAVLSLLNDLLDASAANDARLAPADRERVRAQREAAKAVGAQRLAPRDCVALASTPIPPLAP